MSTVALRFMSPNMCRSDAVFTRAILNHCDLGFFMSLIVILLIQNAMSRVQRVGLACALHHLDFPRRHLALYSRALKESPIFQQIKSAGMTR